MKFNVTQQAMLKGPRDYQEDAFLYTDKLLCIVDGMGGHENGAGAARAAIDTVSAFIERGENITPTAIAYLIVDAGKVVNKLYEGEGRAPGSTIVVVGLGRSDGKDALIVGHAGDSIAYFNNGTRTSAHVSANGAITNCLGGAPGMLPIPDVSTLSLDEVSKVLLTSDGMDKCLSQGFDFDSTELASKATSWGLYDNTTFLLAEVEL